MTRLIPYLLLTLIFINSSCNVRRANRTESRSNKQLTEDTSMQNRTAASLKGNQLILVNDSVNHEYQVRIFPLDTFSFSAERGFKGKAASIEFAGSGKQVKESLESTVFSADNREETGQRIILKTNAREIDRSKSTRTSRISWWVVFVGIGIAGFLIWRLGIVRK